MNSRADDAVVRARARLLLQQPFFGSLSLRLRTEASAACKTLQTDGRKLIYNPEFVDALPFEQLTGCIAHEVMHCALAHPYRRGDRDLKQWNRACDFAINGMLKTAGFELPDAALIDAKYDGLSAEEIYRDLQAQQQPQGNGQGNGQGQQPQASQANGAGQGDDPSAIGEVIDGTDENGSQLSPAEKESEAGEWQIAAEQAARSAKASGKVPAGFDRAMEAIRESRVDWRAVLRRFISQTVVSDYTWSRPNRRFIGQGLYLPSTSREGCGELAIAIDTSGSLSAGELAEFAAEVRAIADDLKPEAIHVIYCDSEINGARTFRQFETVELEMKGGGGTDFRPPFEWIEAQGIAPKALLYLTDLCCYSYPEEPDYPVLWVTAGRREAPWGETVRIEPEAAA